MKKRLRKKLRVREFQEMGFTLDFDVAPDNTDAYEPLYARLEALLSSHNLKIVFGYGTLFIRAKPYKSVIAADRQLIVSWIKQQPEAINLNFGPLADFKLTQRVYSRRPRRKSLPVRWSTH